MKFAREVVLVDYLRSPFSRSRPREPEKDLLNGYKLDEVIGMLWKELITRNIIDARMINEAFSVVARYCMKELNIPEAKVNIKGGAVAIGHPLGSTGLRLVGTLDRILKLEGGTYGLATQCCGGGQGIAAIIKRE